MTHRTILLPLLLLATSTACSACRPREARAPSEQPPAETAWFADVAGTAGIDWRLGHGGKTPLPVLDMMGTGCAIQDFDGDGHLDLFLIGQEGTGSTGRCALYLGDGSGGFRNATPGSGLEQPGFYMGCGAGDLDNDGRPDLVVTGYGSTRLYRNLGGGRFQDRTPGSGLEVSRSDDWRTAVALGDFDRDGLLDVYLGRYVIFNDKTVQFCDYGKLKSSCGPKFYDPQFGTLHRNSGGFTFKDVTRSMGLTDQHGKCLGAAFADVNSDGWPDLYLGNDEVAGDLYLNRKGRSFTNVAMAYGVALSGDGQMQGAMGVDFADYNRDGFPDLFITTFEFEPVSLYSNEGGATFTHRSLEAGLDQPTRSKVGFGTRFVDFDNDGWLDLVAANGHIHDNQEQIDSMSSYRQPVQLFLSRGGKEFDDRTVQAGAGFTTPCVGRGLASGDHDEDGKVDLLVTDLEGAPRVLLNRMPATGAWLQVVPKPRRSNRSGIGAWVQVEASGEKWSAEVSTGGSYFSASDPTVHFGLGKVRQVDRLTVRWPGGGTSELRNQATNQRITVEEPN